MANTYFSGFPTTSFNNQTVTNILIRLDFLTQIKDTAVLYEQYQIQDGQTAEDVASNFYDDPNLFWIILWTNDIIDQFKDWPMTYNQFSDYMNQKYGADHLYDTNHYETTDESDLGAGVWVNEGTAFSTAVTNWDYEDSINESKRRINIVKSVYITQILQEYQNELKGISS